MKKIIVIVVFISIAIHVYALCTPVAIAVQPANGAYRVNGIDTFTVSVTGTPPFSFYWYRNNSLVATTSGSASTTSSYITPLISIWDSTTTYHCVITNCSGSDTARSDTAHLVCAPVAIAVQPTYQYVAQYTANITVKVCGTPPFTYNWYKRGYGLVATTPNSYGTTNVYNTGSLSAFSPSGYDYWCIVSNQCNPASFQATTDTLNIHYVCAPPAIYTQPENQVSAIDSHVTFYCSSPASGVSGVTYHFSWFRNGSFAGTTTCTSATDTSTLYSSFTTPALTCDDDNSSYYCVVDNNCATAFNVSYPATISISCTPINTEETIFPNLTNSFLTVINTGTHPCTFTIYNAAGALVFTASLIDVQSTIDIRQLRGGLYFAVVVSDKGTVRKKIIKE